MTDTNINTTKNLLDFIEKSPTAFHAVETIGSMLDESGYSHLGEGQNWALVSGGKYYVTRNQSSLIAFRIPEHYVPGFLITASHSDSPTFKLKTNVNNNGSKYTRLNAEPYGGMIYSTWMDRPLSVAGRVILSENGSIVCRNVKIDRDLVLIPSVAIHQMRTQNSGVALNPAVDLVPLFGGKDASFTDVLAAEMQLEKEQILGMDLYLYNRTHGSVWGADDAFFSAPRIDNLQCAYGTLLGFMTPEAAENAVGIPVYSVFDNEETGSATKQGAGSVFLADTLERICGCLGLCMKQALASSFMISADNAHAVHPNHGELSDNANAPYMNEGIVIKHNAAQKYTTDAFSAAVFTEICRQADVPVQFFHNRSDMPGGSTLGSISNTNVPLYTVDIGLPQLAMHSSYETAGCADTDTLIRACAKFYACAFASENDGMLKML
ncbi:MAG: M18 family aminopeptidase [Ruminococcaceae bacterium]|nr:M18 family aminopeptidase [Oscillospiraceae bacterium]